MSQHKKRQRKLASIKGAVLHQFPHAWEDKIQSLWVIWSGCNKTGGPLGSGRTLLEAWSMARDKVAAAKFAEALTA